VKSNYNSPLKITDAGRKVEAEGPLLWEDGQEERVRVIVTITQDDAIATGTSGNRDKPDRTWAYEAQVDSSGSGTRTFEAGTALAVGRLQVLKPTVQLLAEWTQVVVLEQA
jgi:hypothetical protein